MIAVPKKIAGSSRREFFSFISRALLMRISGYIMPYGQPFVKEYFENGAEAVSL
jgi:hypothetical protein